MSVGYLRKCSNSLTNRPKERFDTQQAAEDFRSSLIAQGKWTVKGSNTYWCNQCGGYHAGSLTAVNRGGGRKTQKNRRKHFDLQ